MRYSFCFPGFTRYLTYIVARWQNFLKQCHIIQGEINGLSCMVGSAVVDHTCIATRRSLFRIYRYVNTVHYLCYRPKSTALSEASAVGSSCTDRKAMLADELVTLGLVTPAEKQILLPQDKKQKEAVLGWIGFEIAYLSRKGGQLISN